MSLAHPANYWMSTSTLAHRHSLNNQCELESSDIVAGQDASGDIGAGVDKRQRGEGRRPFRNGCPLSVLPVPGSGLPITIFRSASRRQALVGQPSGLGRRRVVQSTRTIGRSAAVRATRSAASKQLAAAHFSAEAPPETRMWSTALGRGLVLGDDGCRDPATFTDRDALPMAQTRMPVLC